MRYLLPILLCISAWASPTVTKIADATPAGFGSPYTVSLTAGCPATALLVIAGASNAGGGGAFTSTYSDNAGGNTYTDGTGQQQVTSGLGSAQFAYSILSTGLTSSNTITFTPASDGVWVIDVLCIKGAATSTPVDQIVLNSAVGTGTETFTTGTLTPGTSPTIALMIGTWHFGSWTFGSMGNIIGSAGTSLSTTGNSSRGIALQWRELSTTTAGTASFSVTGTSGDTVPMVFVTFKEGTGGQSTPYMPAVIY